MADQKHALAALNTVLNYENTITVVHNALYDLPVLAAMGIRPRKVACSMVMAYLLQDEPQGLKPLAFRHCGMEMDSYSDMVGGATREKAIAYLEKVMEQEWPDPEPVLEWKKGEPHVRQPQNIRRKVQRVLSSIESGKDIEPYSSWNKMSDTDQVESVLGVLKEADLSDISNNKAIHYSARDADATIRIYPILWERICSLGLEGTFWRDMAALPMVVDMMANGMPVDINAFHSLSNYFQSRMDLIQRKMQLTIGHLLEGKAVNPASYPQMSTLIYDRLELHLKGGKFRSKKGAVNKSTANDILKRYIHLHPSVQDIIDWREYQKLRIRTTLRITRVATGRLSSSKPNLMAQPTRSFEGRKVRDCYVAGEGNLFLSGDYSQVEMRVAANDSKDETMMGIFWRGEDIHAITASRMFGVPISQLDEMKHRYPAKRVGFGILNLITAEGLQRELTVGGAEGWSISDCEEMIKSWFDIYRGIAAYMKASGEQAKRYGYVRDMWGRIRYIPGIRSVNRWARIEAERQAGNAPIQMAAQGIIKEAMGRLVPVYRDLNEIGMVAPLLQVHDDLCWEIAEYMMEIVKSKIRPIMEGVAPKDFIIPLPIDFKEGKKWGSIKKINR
jgi:DNA polymerase-1